MPPPALAASLLAREVGYRRTRPDARAVDAHADVRPVEPANLPLVRVDAASAHSSVPSAGTIAPTCGHRDGAGRREIAMECAANCARTARRIARPAPGEGHVQAQQLRAVEEVARERGEAEDADDGLAVAEGDETGLRALQHRREQPHAALTERHLGRRLRDAEQPRERGVVERAARHRFRRPLVDARLVVPPRSPPRARPRAPAVERVERRRRRRGDDRVVGKLGGSGPHTTPAPPARRRRRRGRRPRSRRSASPRRTRETTRIAAASSRPSRSVRQPGAFVDLGLGGIMTIGGARAA